MLWLTAAPLRPAARGAQPALSVAVRDGAAAPPQRPLTLQQRSLDAQQLNSTLISTLRKAPRVRLSPDQAHPRGQTELAQQRRPCQPRIAATFRAPFSREASDIHGKKDEGKTSVGSAVSERLEHPRSALIGATNPPPGSAGSLTAPTRLTAASSSSSSRPARPPHGASLRPEPNSPGSLRPRGSASGEGPSGSQRRPPGAPGVSSSRQKRRRSPRPPFTTAALPRTATKGKLGPLAAPARTQRRRRGPPRPGASPQPPDPPARPARPHRYPPPEMHPPTWDRSAVIPPTPQVDAG